MGKTAEIQARQAGIAILVAEDSPTQAEGLRSLLAENGYDVAVAANGAEALAAARRRAPALVISDILMPGMDGYALCKAVKSDAGLKETPVVLLTSLSSSLDVVKGLECGADNFIRKPYDDAYLLSRIRHVLANRELRRAQRMQMGIEIELGGQRHFITSERQQILDLLLSTYEQAVQVNDELRAREQDLARSQQIVKGVYRIAAGLNQATSEREVVETTLERALELPGVRAGWISLREGEAGFRIAATRGLPPALAGPGAFDGDCLCRRLCLSGGLDHVTNILECERLKDARDDTEGLRYHASVPLWTAGHMLGVLNLAGPDQGLFSDDDLEVLYGVGTQVGVALERAHLLEGLEWKVEERTRAFQAESAERAYAEEERARLAAILDATPDFVAMADPQGRVLYLNRAGRGLLGIGPDEDVSSVRAADGHPEWARKLVLETAIPAAIRDGAWRGETAFLDREGREVPFSQVILAHKSPAGAVEFLATIGRDLSEQKSLEAQLSQAQKMEAIGQLAGGVAHDFNNILGVVTGYAEILLRRLPQGDPLCRHAQQIAKAAERAAGLTHQLLAFSRKQTLKLRRIDINTVVAGMDAMLRRLIGEDIELATLLAPGAHTAIVDPGQLEQVLMNLAANARDAMPEGGRLTIETRDVTLGEAYARDHVDVRPGRYTMLAVSDTGQGMDEATRAHIFEPFFTTKELGKGTGLGLATVYGIVKQSGGHVSVYSEPGRGTTFKIYLPQIGERAQNVAAAAREAVAHAEAPGGSETILVVEDEEALRNMIREVLEEKGYAVLLAPDGAEAIPVAEAHAGPIHLLLADVVMPGLSARELLARLSALRPGLRCVFMSGYTGHAALRNGTLPEGHGFLDKPFTPDGLLRKVREALDAP